MSNVWVISDTHFNHANFLTFKDKNGELIRKFDNVDQMNDCMVTNWNETVKPEDKVYHLGDVFFGHPDKAHEILSKLHGKKRLILGNHDDLERKSGEGFNVLREHFKKILMWRCFGKEGIVLSHVPLRVEDMHHDTTEFVLNAHGHIHEQVIDDLRYLNVCVEHTGYTPISFDELCSIRDKRKKNFWRI